VSPHVNDLLLDSGVEVHDGVAKIPELLALGALGTVPREFCLYRARWTARRALRR
jgi:hypothetical protein